MLTTLGGVQFEGGEGRARFTIATYEETVGTRRDDVPRPLSHGSFHAPTFRTGRLIQQAGLILTDTPSEQERAFHQLRGILADGQTGRFVKQGDITTWCEVVLDDIDVRKTVHGTVGRYDLQLWSDDPWMFGDVHTFTAGQALFHRGNADAIPEITVTGPFPNGYTLTYRGRSFVVTAALASGARHVVDTRTGWVRNASGVVIQGAVSRAQTFRVPPGLQTAALSISGSGGSGSVSVKVPDTYM